MVDGSSIRCDGTTTAEVSLKLKRITSLFYIVPNLDKGILGRDALSHLDVSIDTRYGRISVDGREESGSAWQLAQRKSLPVKMIKYGKVYKGRNDVKEPNQ